MKVAFSGTSSTGKTTLARALALTPFYAEKIGTTVSVDARAMLEQMGCKSVDEMSDSAYISFQYNYLVAKIDAESKISSFLTERSFVDVFSFWQVRCAPLSDAKLNRIIEEKCREMSHLYDIHFYFPFGLLPVQNDGYRSQNIGYHKNVDKQIRETAARWGINFIRLNNLDIEVRLSDTLRELKNV